MENHLNGLNMPGQTKTGRPVRTVLVSTFPPAHCGIGSYGAQLADDLRDKGYEVTTVSVNQGGNADAKLDLLGGIRPLRLIRYLLRCNRLIINYHPTFFFRLGNDADGLLTNVALCILYSLFRTKVAVICHEIDHPNAVGFLAKVIPYLERVRWLLTPQIYFHTKVELRAFRKRYGFERRDGLSVVSPGAHYRKYSHFDPHSARRALGLDIPPDAKLFLCIGFIQHSKGFDRVIDVFNELTVPENAYLYVVGSLRVELKEAVDYLNSLKEKAAQKNCIRVVDRFTSDQEFDTWINAADFIVLPYRFIRSSAVAERAKLYKKPIIVSSVGGLGEQVTATDYAFRTDKDLSAIVARLLE